MVTITPTELQRSALRAIQLFLDDPASTCFLLKGYAGTGKTHVIGILAKELARYGKCPLLLTPTGRAARVVSQRTSLSAQTIHSLIYQHSDYELFEQKGKDSLLAVRFKLKRNETLFNTLYIVDEASMVADVDNGNGTLIFGSGRLLSDLIEFSNILANPPEGASRSKILFVGDPAQLPPIGQILSPALSEEDLRSSFGIEAQSYTLTEVIRQQEKSTILRNASELRNAIERKDYRTFHMQEGGDVSCSSSGFSSLWGECVRKNEHDKSLVIVYSNASSLEYNKRMRMELFGTHHELPVEGDRLMCIANSAKHGIMNGEMLKVVKSGGEVTRRSILLKGRTQPIVLSFQDIDLQTEDGDGNGTSLRCKILLNCLWSPERSLTQDEYLALRLDLEDRRQVKYPSKSSFAKDRKKYEEQRTKYLEAVLDDEYFNGLQVKFGFAVTCHKAQGGEWPNVFVDFDGPYGKRNEIFFRWSYTAVTRAKVRLYALHPPQLSVFGISAPSSKAMLNVGREAEAKSSTNDHAGDGFLPWLHQQIASRIDSQAELVHVRSMPYRERFHITKESKSHAVDVVYDKRFKVKNIDSGSDLMQEMGSLEQLRGLQYAGPGCLETNAPSHEGDELLDEIRIEVDRRLVETGIRVSDIQHLRYRARYTFVRTDEYCALDIIYDGKGVVTNIEPRPGDGHSPDLARELRQILTLE